MSAVNQAVAPIIGMLKSIVTFFVIMMIAYFGTILFLKQRITNKRQFGLYKDMLAMATLLIMGLFVYWRVTHT